MLKKIFKNTPLLSHISVNFLKTGTVEEIKIYVNKKNIKHQTSGGWEPLHVVCGNNPDALIIKYLISQGAPINSRLNVPDDDRTPLHILCANKANKDPKALLVLLENGADPNLTSGRDNLTPLHKLCSTPPDESMTIKIFDLFIDTMLKFGAKIDCLNGLEQTPLNLLAHTNPTIPRMEILLKYGANVLIKDTKKWNLLHIVCKYFPKPEIVEWLCNYKIPVNDCDQFGWTPGHLLALNPNTPSGVIQLLIDNGLDLERKDGKTITDLAKEFCVKSVIDDIYGELDDSDNEFIDKKSFLINHLESKSKVQPNPKKINIEALVTPPRNKKILQKSNSSKTFKQYNFKVKRLKSPRRLKFENHVNRQMSKSRSSSSIVFPLHQMRKEKLRGFKKKSNSNTNLSMDHQMDLELYISKLSNDLNNDTTDDDYDNSSYQDNNNRFNQDFKKNILQFKESISQLKLEKEKFNTQVKDLEEENLFLKKQEKKQHYIGNDVIEQTKKLLHTEQEKLQALMNENHRLSEILSKLNLDKTELLSELEQYNVKTQVEEITNFSNNVKNK
ncbi:ankyrin repeat-containing protein [Anaeramoeba flamelloides]|uniref:Ankyrin repeat-containing protein n=1 Tax=Anaeramoeba flamelloides TaxID=1746091 RepID=A0ABQ8Z5Z7_9EUKA|nr:ankyrin repeat-containing protein [Anaeramoeba flamelloides]